MLLPDVTAILDDPQVGGGQSFTVKRNTRKHNLVNGNTITTETFTATGNVQPSGAVGLQQMAPQDRKNVQAVIRSTFTFQIGGQTVGGQVDPDIVIYNGNQYRVLQVQDWSQWGFMTAYITLDKGGIST